MAQAPGWETGLAWCWEGADAESTRSEGIDGT